MSYHVSSTLKVLLLNLKIEYLLIPWTITIDFQNELIEIKQRNWFLIGFKVKSVSLRFIRSISIQEHLFGANILIRTMGENLSVNYIEKLDAQKIKNLLLEYNKGKAKQIIIT